MASQPSQQQDDASPLAPAATTTLIDHLPLHVLAQHIVAHPALDGAARLALFQSCHALARLVLQHGHGNKCLSVTPASSKQQWPPALARLLGTAWRPLAVPGGLELQVANHLAPPPPAAVSQLVSHLHLQQCTLAPTTLPAWRLHDAALWPRLRHLTLTECQWPQLLPGGGGRRRRLQPIPRLASFTWVDGREEWDQPPATLQALLPLVERATRLHLNLAFFERHHVYEAVLPRFKGLESVRVDQLDYLTHNDAFGALLRLPAHVTVVWLPVVDCDLSQRTCRWRSLTVLGGASVEELGWLPLGGLERLTLHRDLCVSSWREEGERRDAVLAGQALLGALHGGGRLALEPWDPPGRCDKRGLQADDACFTVGGPGGDAPFMFRLALEAGRGLTALDVTPGSLPLRRLREEVAPLLQRHAGKVTALCFQLPAEEEWCQGVLGALPPCVTRVVVSLHTGRERSARALVQGGVTSLRHPLKLTLVFELQDVGRALEAELLSLARQSRCLESLEVLPSTWWLARA